MKTQQCVPYVLLSHKIFGIAVNNINLHANVFMQSPRHFSPILTKSGFSRQIFIKVSNIKFHENQSSGCWLDTSRQTDGRTWPCFWVNKDPAPFVRQPEWTNTLTSWYVFSYSSFNNSVRKSGYTGIMIGKKKCGGQLQSCKWKYYPRICPAELRQNLQDKQCTYNVT